jgi:CelD/BcsL family acetyltransferase involved in cellulose biosynthesis
MVRIDPRAVDESGLRAWAELSDRAVEPNAFYRPEFLLANVIERNVRAELLVVMEGDRWIACLPIRSLPASAKFPLPYLAALVDDYTFSGTPLLDREALDVAADGLVSLIRAERRAAAVLLPIFESNGPASRAIDAAAERRGAEAVRVGGMVRAGWRRSTERHFPGPAFNRSDQKELRRRQRLLVAELGGDIRVVDRSSDPTAIEAFLAMEHSGWKAERGNPLARIPGDAAFFRRMCAGMSAAGCLEIVSLEVSGRTLAMEVHLIEDRAFWSFRIAHDPAYRRFSPGTQLKYRVIDGLEDRALDLADSCAVPDNAHMNRLWPDRRVMDTLLVPTGAPLARLVPILLLGRGVARRVRAAIASRRRGRPGDPSPSLD